MILVLLLFLVIGALASTDQNPTHTPTNSSRIIEPPTTRGTWDILSVCMTILIYSTFMALHPNVPKKDKITHHLKQRLLWGMTVLIAPEVLIGLAFQDWILARTSSRIIQMYGSSELRSWAKHQIFFANMGGIVILARKEAGSNNSPENVTVSRETDDIRGKINDITRIWEEKTWEERKRELHRLWENIFGFIERIFSCVSQWILRQQRPNTPPDEPLSTEASEDNNLSQTPTDATSTTPPRDAGEDGESGQPQAQPDLPLDHEISIQSEEIKLHLNSVQILIAQLLGILGPQNISKSAGTIDAKSSPNPLAKVLFLYPFAHFAFGTTKRLVNGLPLSQLELSALTYALATLLAYIFYWSKPQFVSSPVAITVKRHPGFTPRIVTEIDLQRLTLLGGTSFFKVNFYPPFGADGELRAPQDVIPGDSMVGRFLMPLNTILHDADFASIVTGTLIGFLYCLGWNSTYPTEIEKYLWRTAGTLMAVLLIPYAMVNSLYTRHNSTRKRDDDELPWKNRTRNIRQNFALYSIFTLYVMSRLFLIIEMVRTLFYQPSGTFIEV